MPKKYEIIKKLNLLIARDVLAAPLSVPNGGSITVIYTWKISE